MNGARSHVERSFGPPHRLASTNCPNGEDLVTTFLSKTLILPQKYTRTHTHTKTSETPSFEPLPPYPALRPRHTPTSAGANRDRRRASPREPGGCPEGGVGDGRHTLRPRAAELGGWAQVVRWLLGVCVVSKKQNGVG